MFTYIHQVYVMLKLYLKTLKIAKTHPSDHKQTIPNKTHNKNLQQKQTPTHKLKHNYKQKSKNIKLPFEDHTNNIRKKVIKQPKTKTKPKRQQKPNDTIAAIVANTNPR